MSLQIWLPLNGNTDNQGLKYSPFYPLYPNNINFTTGGKVTEKCSCGEIYSDTPLRYKKNFSVCAWIYSDSLYGVQFVLSESRVNATMTGWGLRLDNDSKYWTFSNTNVSCGNITVGEWYHVCMTVSNNMQIRTYLNGQFVETKKCNTSPSYAEDIGIGIGCFRYNGGNIYKFKGKINDFRLYDHCLSEKEIKNISKGLCLHYKLTKLNIDKEPDCSGYINDGIINGDITYIEDTPRYSYSSIFENISTKFNYNSLITINFWIKINNKNDWKYIVGQDENYYLSLSSLNNVDLIKTYIDGELMNSYSLLTDNEWHYYSLVCQLNNWTKLILNSGTCPMSDFRIYTTELNSNDINELYNQSASIDNTNKLYSREFIDSDNLSILKNGQVKINFENYPINITDFIEE